MSDSFHNQGKEFLTLRKIIVCYILIFLAVLRM